MKKNSAILILLILLALVLVFHFGILLKMIPYEITWGGRIENDTQMYVFEAISIFINLLLIFLLLMKGKGIRPYFSDRIVDGFLWAYLILFLLNTVGNIFAKTAFEKGFSVVTLIFSILIWMILRKEKPKKFSSLQGRAKENFGTELQIGLI